MFIYVKTFELKTTAKPTVKMTRSKIQHFKCILEFPKHAKTKRWQCLFWHFFCCTVNAFRRVSRPPSDYTVGGSFSIITRC